MPNGTEKYEKKGFVIGKEVWFAIILAITAIIIGSVVNFVLPALTSSAPTKISPSIPSVLPIGAVVPSDKVGGVVKGDGFTVETFAPGMATNDPGYIIPKLSDISFSKGAFRGDGNINVIAHYKASNPAGVVFYWPKNGQEEDIVENLHHQAKYNSQGGDIICVGKKEPTYVVIFIRAGNIVISPVYKITQQT